MLKEMENLSKTLTVEVENIKEFTIPKSYLDELQKEFQKKYQVSILFYGGLMIVSGEVISCEKAKTELLE